MTTTRTLTTGQRGILGTAAAVMVAVGVAGAVGTYSNAVTEFHRQATAAGVVAAGEGLTLVLALTLVGLTLLGQSSPAWVRIGLWLAPLAACGMGLALADTLTEAVIYSVMPLGMSGAAEGLGLISRRIVIYSTGIDAEALRRNAAVMQRLAYHRARAANHPDERRRQWSERAAWRLARHVGVGDAELGADLIGVQRSQLTAASDAALLDMFTVAPAPATAEVTLERADDQPPAALESRPRPEVVPAGVRLLPIVARPAPVEVTTEQQSRPVEQLPKLVIPQATVVAPWADKFPRQAAIRGAEVVTTAVPAETARQVVTEVITLTPSELRRRARSLNREAVRSNGRSVTIKTLQDELGLSRREATDLRREVVGSERSGI